MGYFDKRSLAELRAMSEADFDAENELAQRQAEQASVSDEHGEAHDAMMMRALDAVAALVQEHVIAALGEEAPTNVALDSVLGATIGEMLGVLIGRAAPCCNGHLIEHFQASAQLVVSTAEEEAKRVRKADGGFHGRAVH